MVPALKVSVKININPLGFCHELRQIERSNSLEEILIKVSTYPTLRLLHDFLGT
jgi:hypothetical protein